MNEGTRNRILVASSLIAMVAVALWLSYGYLADQRSAAQAEASELASCKQLASQIESLQGKGVSVREVSSQRIDIGRQVAAAMSSAEVDDSNLEGIHPDAPRHADKGGYLEKPTRLVFRRITLRQFTTILQALNKTEDGLRVEKLHLSADNESPELKRWTADIILVQTVAEKSVPTQALSLSN